MSNATADIEKVHKMIYGKKLKALYQPNSAFLPAIGHEKKGFVMKREKGHFKRIYLILKDVFLFYYFNGRERGEIHRSENIHILLCEVKMVDFMERRFCFEIQSLQTTILLQAETEDEYRDWIRCLELAKTFALKQENRIEMSEKYRES